MRLLAIMLMVCFTHPLLAQEDPAPRAEKTTIYATSWGMTLAADGTGFYNDLARLILSPLMDDIRYDLIPYRRANRIFVQDNRACHFPSTLSYMQAVGVIENTDSFIQSGSFMRTMGLIFGPYETRPPASPDDIRGKIIAYPMGAEIPRLLPNLGVSFIPVADETGKAEMLLSGRVDFMVAYMPDAKFVFDQLAQRLPPFDPTFAIHDEEIAIVCHRTAETEALIDKVNSRILAAREDGSLTYFLGMSGIDPEFYLRDDPVSAK